MSARAAVGNRASMTPKPGSLLCQSDTGILGPSEGGREGVGEGPRKEGRTREGGRERRAEQMSVVRGSCGPCSLKR